MGAGVVGRDRELAGLVRLLDPDDPTTVAVLTGTPGVGKTTLVDAVADRAARAGHLVAAARPRAPEQVLSFGVLADLLDACPVSGLADEHQAVLRAALDPAGAEQVVDPRAVAVAVRTVLTAAARHRPLLLVVDDAHWADDASLLVLPHAVRRMADVPVRVLVATRPSDREDPWPTGPHRHDLRLEGLSPAALFHLVRDRLGTTLGRGDLGRLERASAGNPMYALELAAAWRASHDRTTLMTPSLEDLLARQVRRLTTATRRTLLAAALAHDPTAEAVAAATGVVDLDTALREAEAVAELRGGRVRFRHPLHAAAVVADAGPEELRRAHGALAAVETGTEVVARHLGHAADGPDPVTAHLLEAAATGARARGAHPVARDLLGLAVGATPPDDAGADVRRLRLAGWALHDGDPQTCAEAATAVVAGDGPLADRARLLLARRAALVDGVEPSRVLAQAVLDHADQPTVRAGALLVLADTIPDLASARATALRALDALGAPTDDDEEAGRLRTATTTVLAHLEHALRLTGADRRLRAAVELERRYPTGTTAEGARFAAALQDLFASRLAEARGAMTQLLAECRQRGDETSEPVLLLNLGHLELRAGALDAAGRHAREGLALAELVGQAVNVGLGLLQVAADDARTGDDASANARLARAGGVLEPFDDPWLLAIRQAATGRVHLTRGDIPAAVAALRRIAPLAEQSALRDTGWNPYPADLAEALVATGDLDGAEAELRRLLAGVEGLPRPHVEAAALRARAGLAAARSGPVAGLPLALEAVAAHERLGLRLELGRSLLVAGVLHRRARQKAAAHRLLQRAVEVLSGCPAPRWAARAADELARVGLRPAAPGTLTPTEERVARLAVAGRTNREIAAEVYASAKTVEAVLGRVYRKLGVRSRVELVSVLPDADGEPATS